MQLDANVFITALTIGGVMVGGVWKIIQVTVIPRLESLDQKFSGRLDSLEKNDREKSKQLLAIGIEVATMKGSKGG